MRRRVCVIDRGGDKKGLASFTQTAGRIIVGQAPRCRVKKTVVGQALPLANFLIRFASQRRCAGITRLGQFDTTNRSSV